MAGTSLVVSPANSLVYRANPRAVRVVVNNEPVGAELGIQYGAEAERDLFLKGECDEVFLELMGHLGWHDDLADMLDSVPLPEQSRRRLEDFLGRNTSSDAA